MTVVGNPDAHVITSSPATSASSPSAGDVSAAAASRFAEDPELQSRAAPAPMTCAKRFSNSSAKRPVVSQKSSDASTSDMTSAPSNTRPDTGTVVSPATNGGGTSSSAA